MIERSCTDRPGGWALVVAALALAIWTSCSPARVPAIAVVIPGGGNTTVGCADRSIRQHEFDQQRLLLCRDGLRTSFVFFDERNLKALPSALRRASASDIIEMPFEICPDALGSDVRRDVVRALAAMNQGGKLVVAAAGNRGSLNCRQITDERFPADLDGVVSIGSGTAASAKYTLRWRDKPDYFVSWDGETLASAGTSFAAARFVLWHLGLADGHTRVEVATRKW